MLFLKSLPVLAYAGLRSAIKAHPMIATYIVLSSGYEGTRTLPRVENAKWHPSRFGEKYAGGPVPLLRTEKLAAGLFCALKGVASAPLHLIEDVKWIELQARGLDPLEYGYSPQDVTREHRHSGY